jgi:gluconate kinase
MQIFLFGCPGSGKSFVGKILQDDFDFFFYDGDELLTIEMKQSIEAARPLSDSLATQLIQLQNDKFNQLKTKYQKLAVSQPLLERRAQERFAKELFPDAIFIKVDAPKALVNQRLEERGGHFINVEIANKIIVPFEEPEIVHKTLHNDEGKQKIINQLKKVLNII